MNRLILVFLPIYLFISQAYTPDVIRKSFQGKIVYQASIADQSDIDTLIPEIPEKITCMYKDELFRIEYETVAGKTIIFGNSVDKTLKIVFETNEKTYVTTKTADELATSSENNPEILLRYDEEQKTICGYECKKVSVFVDDQNFSAFYTKKIQIPNPNWHNHFKDIDHVLLQYSQVTNGIKVTYTATSVSEERIKNKVFDMPEEYVEVPSAEFDGYPGL